MELLFRPVCVVYRDNLNLPYSNTEISSQSGLNNQLFGVVNNIILAIASDVDTLIFDGALTDINNGTLINMSDFLDFEKTTSNISKLTGREMIYLDRHKFNFTLKSAIYGIKGLNTVDVIEKITHSENFIDIKGNTYNRNFKVDPISNCMKKLYLTIDFNGKEKHITLNENNSFLLNDYVLNTKIFTSKKVLPFWYGYHGGENFVNIFKCLVFNSKFYDIVNTLSLKPMNVLHLRLEDDFINYIERLHFNIDYEMTKSVLSKKYVDSLKELNPDEQIYVLTSDDRLISLLLNDTDQYLNESIHTANKSNHTNVLLNGGRFLYLDYQRKLSLVEEYFGYSGREMCGIVDLIIGMTYSTNFIGYFNLERGIGSTFSYAISLFCKEKIILLKIEN